MGNLVAMFIIMLVGLVLFIRWKDSSVNWAAEDSFAMKHFGWRWKTSDFVLLALATCGVSVFYFAYTSVDKLQAASGVKSSSLRFRVLICIILLLYAELSGMSANEFILEQRMLEAGGMMVVIGLLLQLASIVLLITLSFSIKKHLEQMLLEEGLPQQLSGVMCFFFPIVYQYYIIVNAEKRHAGLATVARAQTQTADAQPDAQEARLDRLRQLAELKEQGALSEEEFQTEKRKILDEGRE